MHQMWSGSAISAQWCSGRHRARGSRLLVPEEDGGGTIGNDNVAIPKAAKNPVLAHHFLNYLLDEKHGYDNFSNYVGYQPPFTKLENRPLDRGRGGAREPKDGDRSGERTSTRGTS